MWHGLVGLAGLGHPQPDDLGILLAHRHHAGDEVRPLPAGAGLGAIGAQLVDVGRRRRRLRSDHGVEQPHLLADQVGPGQRDVLARPARVLAELAAQARALVEVAVAPQVHDLVEMARSRSPSSPRACRSCRRGCRARPCRPPWPSRARCPASPCRCEVRRSSRPPRDRVITRERSCADGCSLSGARAATRRRLRTLMASGTPRAGLPSPP